MGKATGETWVKKKRESNVVTRRVRKVAGLAEEERKKKAFSKKSNLFI